jgi:hypothetical protein
VSGAGASNLKVELRREFHEALCYAIFERAAGAVREATRQTDLDQEWS